MTSGVFLYILNFYTALIQQTCYILQCLIYIASFRYFTKPLFRPAHLGVGVGWTRNPLNTPMVESLNHIYTVSQNKLHKLFQSELRQISINFNNF